ncbi:MAG: nucleotide pyrophosphohydrolase [Thermogemmata sp.]
MTESRLAICLWFLPRSARLSLRLLLSLTLSKPFETTSLLDPLRVNPPPDPQGGLSGAIFRFGLKSTQRTNDQTEAEMTQATLADGSGEGIDRNPHQAIGGATSGDCHTGEAVAATIRKAVTTIMTDLPGGDASTPIAVLKEAICHFAAVRGWEPYHTPKNLALALASEVGELCALFRWLSPEQSLSAARDPQQREAIADELADVANILLLLSAHTGIDLSDAVRAKLEKNARKYPPPQTGEERGAEHLNP